MLVMLLVLFAGALFTSANVAFALCISAFVLASAALPMFVEVSLLRRDYNENIGWMRRNTFLPWLTVFIAEAVQRRRSRK